MNSSRTNQNTMAEQVADAYRELQMQAEGHLPKAGNIVLSERTLVITLDGALSTVEQSLLLTDGGAAQVQEFHEHLFSKPPYTLWREIQRIIGAEESADDGVACTCAKVFPDGSVVHIFRLTQSVPTSVWSGQWAEQNAMAALS